MVDLPHELTSEDYAGDSAEADRRLIALNRGAIDFAGEAVAEYGIDANFFDRAGKTNGAGSPATVAHNESYAAHLAGLGERYELLDAPAMHELTGSRHYLSGLYTPGTVVLQPAGYVRGFAAGLARVAEVHENSPVTAFARDGTGGDAGWRVETPRGAVTSARIVLATNGHLESFGIARGRLMHIFLFACMTEELGPELRARLGGAPRWGITPSDPMGTTMRRIDAGQGGHRIVTRTCAEFRPGMTTRAGQMRRAARVMRRKFDARFPALAGVRMEHAWAGHLCLSWNGVSVTGEIEDGVFAACCQNGLGTTRGTLTGICAAENASGVSSDVTAHFGAQPAPARLAPPPLAQIGATAVLRWREWRARSE
jgi:glycine/D-amino acid oxidase-like deaminating enzyme